MLSVTNHYSKRKATSQMSVPVEQHLLKQHCEQSEETVFIDFLESVLVRRGRNNAVISTNGDSNDDSSATQIISGVVLAQPSVDGCCNINVFHANHGDSMHIKKRPRVRQNGTLRAHGRRLQTKCVRRCITNDTYLRRLYLSQSQAAYLFPLVPFSLPQAFPCTRDQDQKLTPVLQTVLTSYKFELVDASGLQWETILEYSVTNGKSHCRLVGGWALFCRHNKVSIKDHIVFERLQGQSNNIFASIERNKYYD